jgi:hypothetical protein
MNVAALTPNRPRDIAGILNQALAELRNNAEKPTPQLAAIQLAAQRLHPSATPLWRPATLSPKSPKTAGWTPTRYSGASPGESSRLNCAARTYNIILQAIAVPDPQGNNPDHASE